MWKQSFYDCSFSYLIKWNSSIQTIQCYKVLIENTFGTLFENFQLENTISDDSDDSDNSDESSQSGSQSGNGLSNQSISNNWLPAVQEN